MIASMLERLSTRVQAADAWTATDDTLSVTVGAGVPAIAGSGGYAAHLRVRHEGRIGMAGRWDADVRALGDAALASARAGPDGELLLPAPAPSAGVTTAWPGAAALTAADLVGLARRLHLRLERRGREIETWAERSVGRVDVGNTDGLQTGYDTTLVGLGLRVRTGAAGVPLTLRLHLAAAAPPEETDLDRLAATAEARLGPPRSGEAAAGPTRVLFEPRAVRALLEPLRQAMHADYLFDPATPWHGRLGERVLAETISLVDDPLLPGRPGSRPVDDEGVVTRRHALVERGVLRGWLADLLTAGRHGLPATGHAWRAVLAPPQAGWSNVVLEPGTAATVALRAQTGDGVLVADLPRPTGNLVDGRIALATPWAYRLRGGEVTGRLGRVVVRGNVYELLSRVAAVGAASEWWGAVFAPPVLVDDVELA